MMTDSVPAGNRGDSRGTSPPEPRKILIAVRELSIGGSEKQACLVARLLDPRIFQVTVGCFIPRGLRRAELDAAGIPVMEIPVRSFGAPGLPRTAFEVRRKLQRKGISLVHSFDYPTAIFFAMALAGRSGIPLLTSLRSYRHLIPQPYRFMLRQAERFSDGIVLNSAEVRADLVRNEGIPENRLHLVYNAVDPAEFPPPPDPSARPRPPELTDASLVVGCVCGIRAEKDLPTLMRAVHSLHPEFPGLRLVLVGSGAAEPQIESLRTELGMERTCVRIPQTANAQPWLAAMDIFVLPSLTEALSNAVLEAMCTECAVVASRVGGNPEIIESGENGLLFPAGDVGALSAALRSLIVDPERRRAMAAAGRESVIRRFSPAAATANLARLYKGFP